MVACFGSDAGFSMATPAAASIPAAVILPLVPFFFFVLFLSLGDVLVLEERMVAQLVQ